MTSYFTGVDSRPAINSNQKLTNDGAKTELLFDYYEKGERKRLITKSKEESINEAFVRWTELLFSGFNIAVIGPLSKFALLETYRTEYLESGKISDFNIRNNDEARERRSNKKKKTNTDGYLNVHTVILHGMEPVKIASFDNGIFGIKEQRRSTTKDYQRFVHDARSENKHYVFIIHSFELFQRDSGDVLDVILKLYTMDHDFIHIVLSSDYFNGSKKLNSMRFQARLLFLAAPYVESFFMEKSQLASALDLHQKGSGISHRLFEECVDLQALKDVYQALGPTKAIMFYIIENFVQKSELNSEQVEERHDETLTTLSHDRQVKKNRSTRKVGRSRGLKPIETDLDFHDLLRYCESALFIRRGAALEQHLGELRDHKIIANDETNNKIQCIINLATCKKFIEYVKSSEH